MIFKLHVNVFLSPLFITANLSLSTCSTSEVEGDKATSSNEQGQEKEESAADVSSGEKEKAGSKGKAAPATLAEAGFITVHLKMPGVPHPVDVMVIVKTAF